MAFDIALMIFHEAIDIRAAAKGAALLRVGTSCRFIMKVVAYNGNVIPFIPFLFESKETCKYLDPMFKCSYLSYT